MSIEYDLSTDGDDDALNLPGLASDGVPGLLVSVEFDDAISNPIVENGKVRMPRRATQQYASFKKDENGATAVTPGWLCGMDITETVNRPEAEYGVVKFPLAQSSDYFSTPVAGAIINCYYSSSITSPVIENGNIILPYPSAGEETLQGVVDSTGYFHPWDTLQGFAGSQVQVATTMLQIDANTSIPISLSVGFNGKGVTFNLYNA